MDEHFLLHILDNDTKLLGVDTATSTALPKKKKWTYSCWKKYEIVLMCKKLHVLVKRKKGHP
jgi:hypothetical protein